MKEARDLGISLASALRSVRPDRQKSAAADALVRLLIKKGIFTEAEWLEAQRVELNEDVAWDNDRQARASRVET